jgi:toxin-antitoxin system PIN domain toxin
MKLVDLNVLLYAVNRKAPLHGIVRSWWEAALSDEEPVALAWIVLLGFLRLATNARVFPRPLTPGQAMERVEAWIAHPKTRLVAETGEHWRILRELLEETGTAGNLTTDAHLAALAISHGATLVSCDADFGRYRGLRWENPVS